MSFLFEIVFQGIVEGVCELIARRFGAAGCLTMIVGIALAVGLIIWSIA